MKKHLNILLILGLLMGSFSISKGMGSCQNVPSSVSFTTDGNPKSGSKKDKPKKIGEDKSKKSKKPAEPNKAKRAEQEPVYHPRTVIVV